MAQMNINQFVLNQHDDNILYLFLIWLQVI